MSEGPRVRHSEAVAVAEELFQRWDLSGGNAGESSRCFVVGSVRRQRADVGDLELVAPLPTATRGRATSPSDDPLFSRINATVTNPWRDEAAPLFAAESPAPGQPLGSAIRGLKPGFLACSLVLQPWPGIEIPCQVYRYTPENLGWMLIERTGPRKFGMWFLGAWKRRYGIPIGVDGRQASIDNHLVDGGGRVVPVWSEEEAFRLAGERYVPPEDRDAFMARLQASREALR